MIRINNPLWGNLAVMGLVNIPSALNDAAILQWSNNGTINPNVIAHIASYLVLPPQTPGPYEIHPYIDREKQEFDLSRKYLLLGTCPPNSYMHNIPALAPLAVGNPPSVDFYYGNMASLWGFFGLNFNLVPNPLKLQILNFLAQNSIAISDVVLGTQRKNFSKAADKYLYNILPNTNICKVFEKESAIENILFTSGSLSNIQFDGAGTVKINPLSTLSIFLTILQPYCRCEDLIISGQPDGNGAFYPFTQAGLQKAINDQNGHIIWYLKCNSKIIRIINLPTPATGLGMMSSRFFCRWVKWKAMRANLPVPLNCNNLMNYMAMHPTIFPAPFNYTNQYRSKIYQMAINNLPLLFTL